MSRGIVMGLRDKEGSTVNRRLTEYYDQYWSSDGYNPAGNIYPELAALLGEAGVGPTTHCIDVGCGDGGTTGLWLLPRVASYVGVDISSNAIDMARARGLDGRVIEDATVLPFPDSSFDMAVCVEVLEHLLLPNLALREINRILKPAGRLIVTVPNVAYWRRRVDLAAFGRWHPMGDSLAVEQPWRDPHLRFFTLRTLGSLLRTTGFQVLSASAHGGALVRDVPVLRRFSTGRAGVIYRAAERFAPSILGMRLSAIAERP